MDSVEEAGIKSSYVFEMNTWETNYVLKASFKANISCFLNWCLKRNNKHTDSHFFLLMRKKPILSVQLKRNPKNRAIISFPELLYC